MQCRGSYLENTALQATNYFTLEVAKVQQRNLVKLLRKSSSRCIVKLTVYMKL